MKPIALQLYTVRDDAKQGLPAVLRKVAEIGYAGVEFAGLHDHPPAEIRKVLDDHQLVAASMHVPLPTAETMNETVETAQALGSRHVVVPHIPAEDFATADAVARTAASLEGAAERLAGHGLTLGYHNHRHEMIDVEGKLALDRLYEAAPNVAPQIDVYWASNWGQVDAAALVARWAHRLRLLHAKDGPLVEGKPHTAVGAGKMDIPAIVAATNEAVLEWVIVEMDTCAGDVWQAVADSYTYLTGHDLARGRS